MVRDPPSPNDDQMGDLSVETIPWPARTLAGARAADMTADSARVLLREAHQREKQLRLDQEQKRHDDPAIASQRAELCACFRRLLVEHVEFAARKGVERSLWLSIFHRPIEEYRKKVRRAHSVARATTDDAKGGAARASEKRATDALRRLLSEAQGFYEALVVELQSAYGVQCWVGRSSPGSPVCPTGDDAACFMGASEYLAAGGVPGVAQARAVRSLVAGCAIYLGDVARYCELLRCGAEVQPARGQSGDWSEARRLYELSHQVEPVSGNAHNQLAVLATYAGEELRAASLYLRALCADVPFSTARDNLARLLAQVEGRGDAAVSVAAPPAAEDAAARVAAFVQRYCYLHALLFKRTRLVDFASLLARCASQARALVVDGAMPPELMQPLLTAAICAAHLASPACSASEAPPADAELAAGDCATEMLLTLFAALVPVLTLHVGPEHVASPAMQPRVLTAVEALLPAVLFFVSAPSTVRAARPAVLSSLTSALVALGNTLSPLAAAAAATPAVCPQHARLLGLLPLRPALTAFRSGCASATAAPLLSVGEDSPAAARALSHLLLEQLRAMAAWGDAPPLLHWHAASARFSAVAPPSVPQHCDLTAPSPPNEVGAARARGGADPSASSAAAPALGPAVSLHAAQRRPAPQPQHARPFPLRTPMPLPAPPAMPPTALLPPPPPPHSAPSAASLPLPGALGKGSKLFCPVPPMAPAPIAAAVDGHAAAHPGRDGSSIGHPAACPPAAYGGRCGGVPSSLLLTPAQLVSAASDGGGGGGGGGAGGGPSRGVSELDHPFAAPSGDPRLEPFALPAFFAGAGGDPASALECELEPMDVAAAPSRGGFDPGGACGASSATELLSAIASLNATAQRRLAEQGLLAPPAGGAGASNGIGALCSLDPGSIWHVPRSRTPP